MYPWHPVLPTKVGSCRSSFTLLLLWLGVLFEDAAAAAAAAAIILEAVGEEGSSPLLLWLSNLWSGVVSLTLPGRRVLIVD